MPQITDRKPATTMIPVPPPTSNHHHHLTKDHSKENKTKSSGKTLSGGTGNGPAILDFRDSWLQEVELYKDQARAQQLLTTHNHLHTLDGCQRDNHPHNGYSNNNGNTNMINMNTSNSGGGNETIKKRVRTRSGSDSNNKQDHNNRLHNNNEVGFLSSFLLVTY